ILLLLGSAGAGFVAFMVSMPSSSHSGPLSNLSETETEIRKNVRRHASNLAGDIGPRNQTNPGSLARTEAYLDKSFKALGYKVRRQTYKVAGQLAANIIAEKKGTTDPGQIVILGAHYDSVPKSPGADDNASGVAAMLELARLLCERPLRRTLRFAGFANEGAPFFNIGKMGSQYHAKQAVEAGEMIHAMFSIETIGYFDQRPGSQAYPAPFSYFHPDRGNSSGLSAIWRRTPWSGLLLPPSGVRRVFLPKGWRRRPSFRASLGRIMPLSGNTASPP
ncbi:MAG: M28 family peptidase, partial [Rhodospirillales bacterium]|nr:M28 family peptidase [Rhodospirillales bacterium]